MIPGQIVAMDGDIELNAGRPVVRISVNNTGDRPIQVGSHYHFYETNKALVFDRAKAYGMRPDLPSGTSVRFEPGEIKEVALIAYSGRRVVYGFNGLVNGRLDDPYTKQESLKRFKAHGFGDNSDASTKS